MAGRSEHRMGCVPHAPMVSPLKTSADFCRRWNERRLVAPLRITGDAQWQETACILQSLELDSSVICW